MTTIARTLAAALLALAGIAAHASTQVLAGSLTDVANPNLHDSNLNAPEAPAGPDDVVTNNVALYLLTFSQAGTLTLSSGTYGAGGLDPYVTIFAGDDFSATLYTSNPSAEDDFIWSSPVAAGSYWVAISAWENFSFAENHGTGTLGDGFIAIGDANDFQDGHYLVTADFDTGVVPPPPIPEPSSAWLLGVGLAAFAVRARPAR